MSKPTLPDPAATAERAANLGRGAAVIAASPGRTGKQRRFLRALGHPLKPVVTVGHGGLTPALAAQVEAQLEIHELIKLKVLESAPVTPEVTALWLHEGLAVEVHQIVGRVVLCYRQREKDPTIRLPSGR